MSNTNIYILSLEGGRYYIGKSNNVINRYQQHLNGSGSAWTRKYKPVSLEKIIENVSPFEEDKVTKEYMSKYGIDKVRGGSYVEIELSKFHIDAIKMEIWSAKDLCTQCGRSGHFVKDCYAKTHHSGYTLDCESEDESEDESYECEYCKREFSNEDICVDHVRECKRVMNNPITFSKIAEKPVEYTINMICRYIQQQVNLKRTNADFPLSKFYTKSIAEISESVIRQMSMKNLTFRILSDSSSQYICRTEWKK